MNTNGGTVFIGVSADQNVESIGVNNPDIATKQLEKEIQNRISPPIKVLIETNKYKNKNILRVLVPKGEDTPYVIDDYKIYIRDENETNIAVRDEIVNLVSR